MKKNVNEGVIKFDFSSHQKTSALPLAEYREIEAWRRRFFSLKMIGEYPDIHLGYGNLSSRLSGNRFVITGTQTGKWPDLDGRHYVRITKCIPEKMRLDSEGPIVPSSESMTHWMVYSKHDSIWAVYHVHHAMLWKYMIEKGHPSTPENVEYGTFEMARSIGEKVTSERGMIVMKGHEDGVIVWGPTPNAAGQMILDLYHAMVQR